MYICGNDSFAYPPNKKGMRIDLNYIGDICEVEVRIYWC